MTAVQNTMVEAIKQQLPALIAEIHELDSQIDPESAGRTKVLNNAISEAGDNAVKAEQNVHDLVNGLSVAQRVGVIVSLQRALKKEYGSQIDEFVEENKVEVEEVPAEELTRLTNERATKAGMAKAAYDFLKQSGMDEKELPKVPSARRGRPKGERMGARLSGTFNWSINGVAVNGHKLGDVQKALEVDSVKTVREAIETAYPEFDWKNPPSRIEFNVTSDSGSHNVIGVLAEDDTDVNEVEANEPTLSESDDDEFDFEDED